MQSWPDCAQKPGNLVLDMTSDISKFRLLQNTAPETVLGCGSNLNTQGHLSMVQSALLKGQAHSTCLTYGAMPLDEIVQIPVDFVIAAKLAQHAGFGGAQIHAAHGFLPSRVLSPVFNKRRDQYGGVIA